MDGGNRRCNRGKQWGIDDIGVVERVGDFIKLLKEAEFTYSISAYTSTIALIGVCAEDLCRFFANSAGHNLDSESQNNRVNRLLNLGAITQETANNFHVIRRLRNDCLHYNLGFKQKDQSDLKSDALSALNTIKMVYANILGVVDYKTVDLSKLSEIVKIIASEAANNNRMAEAGADNAIARTRNLFANVFGFDLSLNEGGEPVYKMSVYEVREIDSERDQKELTLFDRVVGIPVIVDISDTEFDDIQNRQIKEGDMVAAALVSISNKLGITGTWRLWSSVEKLG